MRSITRKQFQDAVESGIAYAGSEMPLPERQLLRHVAATEDAVSIGTFLEGCGCPLVLAGIVTKGAARSQYSNAPISAYLARFYGAFDRWFVDVPSGEVQVTS